jgi:hypothetical protein
MLNCPDLDPALANAAYMEFRASTGWLFDDTSDEMVARGRYAIAAIEDLRPATALEARVAAQAIASDAHAADCLRLAAEHRDDLAKVTRCRAQANAMTRQMDRALRTLTTLRKERSAREAVRAAFEMPREPQPAAAPDPMPRSEASDLLPPAALAKAEQFAARNPLLASRIRAAGGLTRKAVEGFRPSSLPDAATVAALVLGGGPVPAAPDRGNAAGG